MGVCVWKVEGGGELLGASRLPREYEKGIFFREQAHSHQNWECPAAELPGLLFCGTDFIITAGRPLL